MNTLGTVKASYESGEAGELVQGVLILRGLVIPIGKDTETIMGRDTHCEVRLVDSRVSKEHAKITFSNGRYFVEDLDSANGTHVNRHKIDARTGLVSGDEILIYPYSIKFNMQARADLGKKLPSDIVNKAGKPKHHFAGQLSILPLTDLIQMINSTNRSGTLLLETEKNIRFEIHFIDGEISDASGAGKSGEEAVYAALTHMEGHFDFTQGIPNKPEKPMETTTVNMLLEGCRRMDEFTIDDALMPTQHKSDTVALKKTES